MKFLRVEYLRLVFVVSVVLAVTMAVASIFCTDMVVRRTIVKDSEDEAIRVARHLSEMLLEGHGTLAGIIERESVIRKTCEDFRLEKLKIFDSSGRIIYSTEASDIGEINDRDYFRDIVTMGGTYSKLVKKDGLSLEGKPVRADVMETYVPVMQSNVFAGAFEIYYDVSKRKERLSRILLISGGATTLLGLTMLAMLGYVLQRAGNVALGRNQDQKNLERSERKYRELSLRDDLTELYNSRHFYEHLDGELARTLRQGHKLSLLMIDVDDFKRYNDTYGHLEGDMALAALGRVLREVVRSSDVPCRYGGEEFVVILPETEGTEAHKVAERIRTVFAAQPLRPGPGVMENLTLSIGVTEYEQGESLPEFLARADQNLYRAKALGKNQSILF